MEEIMHIHLPTTNLIRRIRDAHPLLKIFPEKVWIQILGRADDVDDIEKITNASLFFRYLLTTDRVIFLFPKVWHIMGTRYNNMCWKKFDGPVGFRDYRKHVSDIIKLRLVCRIWSKTIDEFYQMEELHYKLRGEAPNNQVKQIAWTTYSFKTVRDIRFANKFLQDANNNFSQRNPFIGRSVELSLSLISDGYDHLILNNISQFLVTYGHHVWYATVNIRDGSCRLLLTYRRLHDWLVLLPNLKYLFIRYSTSATRTLIPTTEELSGITSETVLNALPEFHSLKYFRTENLPVPIVNSFLCRNIKIRMLDINQIDIHWNYDVFSRSFTNLVHAAMNLNTDHDFVSLEAAKLDWRLTKVNLSFDENLFIEWSRIFRLLENKWGSTLSSLVLRLPESKCKTEKRKILEECTTLKLNLPHCKNLTVTTSNFSSLDFILPLKDTLETFEVNIEYFKEERRRSSNVALVESQQIIKFVGQTWQLHQSNIWELFPKLNKVVVTELVLMRNGCKVKKFYISHLYTPRCKKETKWLSLYEYLYKSC